MGAQGRRPTPRPPRIPRPPPPYLFTVLLALCRQGDCNPHHPHYHRPPHIPLSCANKVTNFIIDMVIGMALATVTVMVLVNIVMILESDL